MQWIVAVLILAIGIGLIAAGSTGSANRLFQSITGVGLTSSSSTPATSSATSTSTTPTLLTYGTVPATAVA